MDKIKADRKKELVQAAKAFAYKKNGGIPPNLRKMLDELKPGITILVHEQLSLRDIQDFCKEHGLRTGIKSIRWFCHENFNYLSHPGRFDPGGRLKYCG